MLGKKISRQYFEIQQTLVISTWLISNNRSSRSENLVPVLTWKSNNRYQNIVEKRRNGAISPLFHNIFNILLTSGVKLHIHLLNVVGRFIVFLNSANLICRGTDISKYSRESLELQDNESQLYFPIFQEIFLSKTSSICLVCVEVLQPSQPNGVILSAISLLNHTFNGQT